MDRIKNYVPNDIVESAALNTLQDRIDNARRAAKDTELIAWERTGQSIVGQFAGAGNRVPGSSFAILEDVVDWRQFLVHGWIATIDGVNDRIHGSAAQWVNTYLRHARSFIGFLGSGSSTSFDRSLGDFYIEADYEPVMGSAGSFYLYADATDGRLKLWNTTVTDRGCLIVVRAIGREP